MNWQEFHDTVAYGIELGRIIAVKTKDGVKLYTDKHLTDGVLERTLLDDAITAEEYLKLAALDMAASTN